MWASLLYSFMGLGKHSQLLSGKNLLSLALIWFLGSLSLLLTGRRH